MTQTTFLSLLALPYAAMALNVLSMCALSHATGRLGLAIVGGVALGALATALGLACLLTDEDWLGQAGLALGTYLAYAFCFWTVINMNITSLRIRLLREIFARPGHIIPEAELRRLYNPREAMERRIERLLAGRQLRRTSSGHYATAQKQILYVARFLYALRRLILPR